ncbi:alpha/beta hydrolase [Dactylosporangium sp. CA-233914]|uniref:alpha/beta hydrolase n=1 Tax=Dactylosporangium sp. CA-233914 TaxID=3239934 RepID=UPI003D9305CA
MPIHPVAQQLLDEAKASDRPNSHLLPIEVARVNFEAAFGALRVEEIHAVEDLVAPTADGEVPVRLYTPIDAGRELPLVVYFHGGGWQMGSIASHDGICRAIGNASGVAVLSVEYRRPPENTFPAAPEDCYAALAWAVDHAARLGIDGTRVAVAGDSAGANLAAAVALMARDRGGPRLSCQALIYPATTFDVDLGFDLGFEGYVLYRDELLWHRNAYFAKESDASTPYASPLIADLTDLPPTLVLTAEYDPIHAQGELYAESLQRAGVEVLFRRYDGMIHGFAQFPALFEQAGEAVEQVARFVDDHLRRGRA